MFWRETLPRLAYVNGRILPLARASVSIEDRAYLFADGVYEVAGIFAGRLFDWPLHMERLARSLRELSIQPPMSGAALTIAAERLVRRNRVREGMLYLQVTRGAARRDHAFPARAVPGLTMTVRPFDFGQRGAQQRRGLSAITWPEERWARRDIKSVSLLPNVLAKQAAREAGAYEAILVAPDGSVTEGSTTTVWMVDERGTALTRPLSHDVLPGSKRRRLLALFSDAGLQADERSFSKEDLFAAREVFLTSTSSPVMPITSVDGRPVGSGTPGQVSLQACELMWREIERQTGWRSPALTRG